MYRLKSEGAARVQGRIARDARLANVRRHQRQCPQLVQHSACAATQRMPLLGLPWPCHCAT